MSVKKSELFTYHPMHIDDLEYIYKLELESYPFPWTKEILRDCILYKYDSYSVFIDDTLVGYIISKISFPETHILNLTVDINYRNNGIGQALIHGSLGYFFKSRRGALSAVGGPGDDQPNDRFHAEKQSGRSHHLNLISPPLGPSKLTLPALLRGS